MIPVLLVIGIAALCWWVVKQASVTFDRPEWWDHADIAVFVVATLGMAYTNYPYAFSAHAENPLTTLLINSLTFGAGATIVSLFLTIMAEGDGMLQGPDGLAPVEARLFEQVTTVDELDAETLERYTE